MARKVSAETRQDLLQAVRERYRGSLRDEKLRILDEFVAVTGYHRKHVIRLFNAERVLVWCVRSEHRHRAIAAGEVHQPSVSRVIGGGVLCFAAQPFNRARDLAGFRVDCGDTLATAVGGEHAPRLVVDQDDIGILADRHLVDSLEGFQIKDRHRTGSAITDEAAPQGQESSRSGDIRSPRA
jgi:hypothetical protein